MPLAPILTDSRAVADFAEELQQCPVIAVDLEADSMHCYQEKVCLLQVSTPERTLLIDPLAEEIDLSPLKPVLANPRIRKIFHAADYDIRCLARDFGIEINGLFDTMISCQFLGEEKVGLADVLNKYFGVELDKQYQRADWSERPLSEGMIRYAAADTAHLHGLVELLEDQLLRKGRLAWVLEEFALLEKARFAPNDGPLFLRCKGAGRLNPRQLAVLEELLQWRDSEARRRDRPLYKVIGNKPLLDIATVRPQGRQGLLGIEGVPPRLVDRFGSALLKAVRRGEQLPEDQLPAFPRNERRVKDPEAEKRMLLLKEWRKEAAAGLTLDPGVLINNAALEELSRCRPKTSGELSASGILKNWQVEVLGEGILATLRS
ncbi:MAG: ribonuclease D [Desulfuromonadales bacterium]|nr:ribonuclease D [Desulfuromonadales bacterium]